VQSKARGVRSNAQFWIEKNEARLREQTIFEFQMKIMINGAVFIVTAFTALEVAAGPIVQPQELGAWSITDFQTIGQTFTAVDSRISTIGFSIAGSHNPFYSPSAITYELLAGASTAGTVLASRSQTLPMGFSGYADADFSPVNLVVGQSYTVVLFSSQPDWLVNHNQWAFDPSGIPIPGQIDYTGGEAILSGVFRPYEDLTFRIEPIPEPASFLFTLAGGVILFYQRRRQAQFPRHARESGSALKFHAAKKL
jgi:hypothetical protein